MWSLCYFLDGPNGIAWDWTENEVIVGGRDLGQYETLGDAVRELEKQQSYAQWWYGGPGELVIVTSAPECRRVDVRAMISLRRGCIADG